MMLPSEWPAEWLDDPSSMVAVSPSGSYLACGVSSRLVVLEGREKSKEKDGTTGHCELPLPSGAAATALHFSMENLLVCGTADGVMLVFERISSGAWKLRLSYVFHGGGGVLTAEVAPTTAARAATATVAISPPSGGQGGSHIAAAGRREKRRKEPQPELQPRRCVAIKESVPRRGEHHHLWLLFDDGVVASVSWDGWLGSGGAGCGGRNGGSGCGGSGDGGGGDGREEAGGKREAANARSAAALDGGDKAAADLSAANAAATAGAAAAVANDGAAPTPLKDVDISYSRLKLRGQGAVRDFAACPATATLFEESPGAATAGGSSGFSSSGGSGGSGGNPGRRATTLVAGGADPPLCLYHAGREARPAGLGQLAVLLANRVALGA
ncbi:unnamed protein product, partial [Phaeothamnion confervicola]